MKIRPVWHCFEGLGHFFFLTKETTIPSSLKEQRQYFTLICKENTIIIKSSVSKWRTKMGANLWVKFQLNPNL